MSQLSVIVRPAVTPPLNTVPRGNRTSVVRSKPFQWRYWLPKFEANVLTFCVAATSAGLMS